MKNERKCEYEKKNRKKKINKWKKTENGGKMDVREKKNDVSLKGKKERKIEDK